MKGDGRYRLNAGEGCNPVKEGRKNHEKRQTGQKDRVCQTFVGGKRGTSGRKTAKGGNFTGWEPEATLPEPGKKGRAKGFTGGLTQGPKTVDQL